MWPGNIAPVAGVHVAQIIEQDVIAYSDEYQAGRFFVFLGRRHLLNQLSFDQFAAGLLGQRGVFRQR